MPFDLAVPESLKMLQCWFGSVIQQPMEENYQICNEAPSGKSIEEEASEYILPSRALSSKERIQIYNQQFWWRFFKVLKEQFPFVTRLFGTDAFEKEIAVPYLTKYPPHHWLLKLLGEDLPKWIEEEYRGADLEIVRDAALLDLIHTHSFTSPHLPALGIRKKEKDELQKLMNEVAWLQPHLFLFEMPYDIFSLRNQFLEHDPDYWLAHDFPKINKERIYHFVFFRTVYNSLVYEELDEAEYRMLELFHSGCSISQAIEWMEKQPNSLLEKASNHLNHWIEKWIVNEWLTYAQTT